ncbi:hypothetical protein OPV22_034496 [Ensete ventricosum]|uniref:Uncharacterized protein n=1 Tax=Ensete ventricosum TaxID=4639 RepID=A0AAV8PUQ8_ENSVE|nr:hypothetical protein OPV22_034496 [Ensete ventricosum]
MITRSNLVEQLREYQMRPKYEWATVSFLSSSSYAASDASARVDVILVIWELLMFAFLVFSGVALYFRRSRRRMLLPLSM